MSEPIFDFHLDLLALKCPAAKRLLKLIKQFASCVDSLALQDPDVEWQQERHHGIVKLLAEVERIETLFGNCALIDDLATVDRAIPKALSDSP